MKDYGRCTKLSELSNNMDGWLQLLDTYGGEMEHAPRMLRIMFLDIIPHDLASEMKTKRRLKDANHLELIQYCREKTDLMLTEDLAKVHRKNLAKEFGTGKTGRIHAVKEAEDTPVPADDDDDTLTVVRTISEEMREIRNQIAALKAPPPPKPHGEPRRGDPRGRNANKGDRGSRGNSPRRSPSPYQAAATVLWFPDGETSATIAELRGTEGTTALTSRV